jgi:hypothetical protein
LQSLYPTQIAIDKAHLAQIYTIRIVEIALLHIFRKMKIATRQPKSGRRAAT